MLSAMGWGNPCLTLRGRLNARRRGQERGETKPPIEKKATTVLQGRALGR